MIDEQLFNRVVSTLKDNSDCVVIGVADSRSDEFRVYYSGDDKLIVRVIEGISDIYIKELISEMKSENENISKESIENAIENIDWDQLFKDLGEEDNGKN